MFARADTVMLSVPDGAATRRSSSQLDRRGRRRRVTTVVDLSTVGPQVAGEVAAASREPSASRTRDGPVSGGVAGARAATISLMFAGPADVLDANRPVLDAIAGNVFHVGDAGRAGPGDEAAQQLPVGDGLGRDVGGDRVRCGGGARHGSDPRRAQRVDRPQLGDRSTSSPTASSPARTTPASTPA